MSKKHLDEPLPELTPETSFNRELSWLDFNRRVLAQAEDERLPLLERVKFLAIFSNNLDEFFMVRVGAWHNKVKLGKAGARADGLTPAQVLREIHNRVQDHLRLQRAIMRDVLAQLEAQGVFIAPMDSLEPRQRDALHAYYHDEVFPVLTPLAVDHARPFPFISNLSLNLAIVLERQYGRDQHYEFVRLKVPDVLPRLVDVRQAMQRYIGPDARLDHQVFVWLEDLIAANLDTLFPGMRVVEYTPFRVTRNADIDYEFEQEDVLDISSLIEETVRERRFGQIVRLSVPNTIGRPTLNQLVTQLQVEPERDVYMVDGALGASSLFELASIDRPDLKYPVYVPRLPAGLDDQNLFDAIRQRDILLHHPYDSFKPVEDFFRLAARDPNVLAIKATLYRVGKNSPVVEALMEARDNDKQVAVLVELKARFDEENNLEWARALEHKGVHVTYGVEELPVKTHAKVSLVVRREADGVRRYLHLGTGNYNATTARIYSDLGLLTCHTELADDASRLFNRLTGYAPTTSYQRLLVAPDYLHSALVALVDNEIAAARAGRPARMIFKMNQLEEEVMIQKLYQASQAGVQVDLLVRGLCCLRPGVPGVSENIRVISHVGRYLEHSRIYYFHNAPPDQRLYLGSADIMRRNLYNRVEVVFPIFSAELQHRLLRMLATYLRDNQLGWELGPDGEYRRLAPAPGEPPINCQEIFMKDSAGLDILP